jgi:hypothetical protein
VDESSFFFLQKLKSTFRSPDSPTYRIITQHHPFYEVANGSDLNELKQNWDYLVNREPQSCLQTNRSSKIPGCPCRFAEDPADALIAQGATDLVSAHCCCFQCLTDGC